MPNIDDIFDYLDNAKWFSTLDLASGFHQIPVALADQEETAFSTPSGHYEFTRMPYRLKNAPRAFQCIINNSLAGLIGTECFVYVDDINAQSDSFETYLDRLRHVLNRLRANNFVIQPAKCEFAKSEIIYLGHKISDKGLIPTKDKLGKIRNFPQPRDVKSLQRFLGLWEYYRKFIPNFSEKMAPLNKLLRGQKARSDFIWPDVAESTFKEHINKVTSGKLILHFPDFTKPLLLHTDASNFTLSAVLSQHDSDGNIRPVSFASRTLNRAEENYSTIEKQMLSIV